MFSILIPVYNFPVSALVLHLLSMARSLKVPFEIILGDDASPFADQTGLKDLVNIPELTIYRMNHNTGRSAIRNFLASKANFENLLFLDDDGWPEMQDFLDKYIEFNPDSQVICGGRTYAKVKPEKQEKYLHWLYGSKREVKDAKLRSNSPYEGFQTNNFWIKKSLFQQIGFDTRIKTYGHEDTVFGFELERKLVTIYHIDNPVRHLGLVDNLEFLEKTRIAIENLASSYQDGTMIQTRLTKLYESLKDKKMIGLTQLSLNAIISMLEQNLLGKNPILSALDAYKLRYFIKITQALETK